MHNSHQTMAHLHPPRCCNKFKIASTFRGVLSLWNSSSSSGCIREGTIEHGSFLCNIPDHRATDFCCSADSLLQACPWPCSSDVSRPPASCHCERCRAEPDRHHNQPDERCRLQQPVDGKPAWTNTGFVSCTCTNALCKSRSHQQLLETYQDSLEYRVCTNPKLLQAALVCYAHATAIA